MTSFVGAAGYEAESGAIPTHTTGDLIIIYVSGATEPTLASGYTQAGSTASIGSRVDKIGYKIAASSSETSGTWTNANRMQIAVYRSASGTLSVGDTQFLYNGFANTIDYPALTLTDTSGSSWVVGFYHTGSNNWDTTGVEPAGTVTRNNTNGADSSGTIDTNGGVTSFSAVSSGTQPNTTNANAATLEIVEALGGLTIDSSPSEINPTVAFPITVSDPATAPTTLNTTGNFNGLTGIAPDSVTGSNPYTITWTLPRTTAKLFDATGYVFDITIGAENVSTSAIPYLPPTGSDYITVGTIDTGAQVYTDYAGGTFVTGDQLVWNNSPDLSFTNDLNFIVTGPLSATVYRIAAIGTVDVEDEIIMTLGTTVPAGSRLPYTKLISYLGTQGFTQASNDRIVAWLVGEGIQRTTFNQMMYDYLGGLGFTGSLNDRLKKWEDS